MEIKARTAVSAVLILSFLCLGAFNPFQSPSKKELLTRLEKLEKQNMDLQQQVSDLERRMDVLTQRVNAVYSGQDSGQYVGGGKSQAGRSPSAVPDLEVVRVSPDQSKGTSSDKSSGRDQKASKGGKVLIQKRQGNTIALVEHKSGKKHDTPLPGTNYIPPPDPETESDNQKTGNQDSGSSPPTLASRKPEQEKRTKKPSQPSKQKQRQSASEKALYSDLQSLWKSKDTAGAVPKMKSYLNRYPSGSHVDEVSYRLGRALYRQGEYNEAIRYLNMVTEDHPTSSYAARSLYLTGLSYLELGRTDKASDVLREVKILYPFSESAKKAEDKLSSCCP